MIGPALAPRRISHTPPRAWGRAATSTEVSVPVLRAGTALSQQDPNPATRGRYEGMRENVEPGNVPREGVAMHACRR
jgi:hypothetical protein